MEVRRGCGWETWFPQVETVPRIVGHPFFLFLFLFLFHSIIQAQAHPLFLSPNFLSSVYHTRPTNFIILNATPPHPTLGLTP